MSGFSKTFHSGFLMCCVLLVVATPVDGASFIVTSSTDLGDANPGDGLCSTSGPFCTLRAAIEESNALGGSDLIILPEGSYVLTLGELLVLTDIDLQGAGAATCIVDGNDSSRVFKIDSAATMKASGLTVRDGDPGGGDGGGFLVWPSSTLILEDAVISSNIAPAGSGAGIANVGGIVSIARSTLSGNIAMEQGGAIASAGDLTVVSTEISGNIAAVGGGLFPNGHTELIDVTVSGNHAFGVFWNERWLGGGGMYSAAPTAALERVTFEDNFGKIGGGIQFGGGNLSMTNTTFVGNEGEIGGGAILVVSSGVHLNLDLTNLTIAGNLGNGFGGGAIALGRVSATVAISNTIIADNGAHQCDSSSQVVSFGHNLETTDTCGLNATSDQVNTPADLAAIADNGGFTRTMALLPGSAAIDTGNDLAYPANDQRGVNRPQDGDDDGTATSDIGAFEVEQPLFADGFETGDTSMWSNTVP